MPPALPADNHSPRTYTKTAGTAPLPGYTLLEPLGRGGFGEVWKCEAPGGLHKAIKFVSGVAGDDGSDNRLLTQEFDAFQQIKAIRHPFLLTLERVEVVADELIMVMELADRQLHDRFRECRNCGLPGIPRDELLAYFADAAEALDMISSQFGLQHLDVKPANLFLVSGHVKVGDYGLVARLDPDGPTKGSHGLTPKYVAPEALRGEPSSRSDQYSLALVYQELLTGTFPYNGRTAQQIMMQHISATPDLNSLPLADRPILQQALAKDPEQRFSSCLAFVQSLMAVASATSLPASRMGVRQARVERSMHDMNLPTAEPLEDEEEHPTGSRRPSESTQSHTLPPVALTHPGSARSNTRLVPATRAPVTQPPAPQPPAAPQFATPQPPAVTPSPFQTPPPVTHTPGVADYTVTLERIRSVVNVDGLTGRAAASMKKAPDLFVRSVVEHAAAAVALPSMSGEIRRLPDGTWVCRFPSAVSVKVAPIKLIVVRDARGLSIEQTEPTQVVLRRTIVPTGLWSSFSKKKSGFQIVVQLPTASGNSLAEITVTGSLFGTPDKEFACKAEDTVPQIMSDVRRELKNVEERRKHPRLPVDYAVTVYPIHSKGGIESPIAARCRDVSFGGLSVMAQAKPTTEYAYVAFDEIEDVSGHAILVRWKWAQTVGRSCVFGGAYRMDL